MPSSTSKNVFTFKDTIKKVKRQSKEWEKIFANHISNKSLISRLYKELKLNNKKTPQFKKTGKELEIGISTKKICTWKTST